MVEITRKFFGDAVFYIAILLFALAYVVNPFNFWLCLAATVLFTIHIVGVFGGIRKKNYTLPEYADNNGKYVWIVLLIASGLNFFAGSKGMAIAFLVAAALLLLVRFSRKLKVEDSQSKLNS